MNKKDETGEVELKSVKKSLVEKKIPNAEPDTFFDYVLSPSQRFPTTPEGSIDLKDSPVPGELEVKALFLRGPRDNDVTRKSRDDGRPYPQWFTLGRKTCDRRLAHMIEQKKPHGDTQRAIEKWPNDQKMVRVLSAVLEELNFST